jgi:hypothetical protein
MNKPGRCVYIYLRLAFVAYSVLLPASLVVMWFDYYELSFSVAIFAIIVGFLIFSAFLIHEGLMYGHDRRSYFGLTLGDTKYGLFMLFTLGYGPIFVYFKIYDKVLKAHAEQNT